MPEQFPESMFGRALDIDKRGNRFREVERRRALERLHAEQRALEAANRLKARARELQLRVGDRAPTPEERAAFGLP